MAGQRSLNELRNEDKDCCPECESCELAFEGGELYCTKCGFVID
jgi:ribosomal protein S27AE